MIPQAAMDVLQDVLVNITNSTMSQSPSPSTSNQTQNGENGFGPSDIRVAQGIMGTAAALTVLGIAAYCYKNKDSIYEAFTSCPSSTKSTLAGYYNTLQSCITSLTHRNTERKSMNNGLLINNNLDDQEDNFKNQITF